MFLLLAGLTSQPSDPAVSFRGFLAIDFGNDGFLWNGSEEPVSFDFDGDHTSERVTWIPSGENDALLFLDRNDNNIVDNGADLLALDDGYDVLRAGDLPKSIGVGDGGNANGILDPPDSLWSRLRLWIDANRNASSEPSEIFTLTQKGVTGIELYRCGSSTEIVCKAVSVTTPQGETTQRELGYVVLRVLPYIPEVPSAIGPAVEIDFCQLRPRAEAMMSNADFSALFSFEVGKDGAPINLYDRTRITREDALRWGWPKEYITQRYPDSPLVRWLADEAFAYICISSWRLRGIPEGTQILAEFKWEHGFGWKSLNIVGQGVHYVIKVGDGKRDRSY